MHGADCCYRDGTLKFSLVFVGENSEPMQAAAICLLVLGRDRQFRFDHVFNSTVSQVSYIHDKYIYSVHLLCTQYTLFIMYLFTSCTIL